MNKERFLLSEHLTINQIYAFHETRRSNYLVRTNDCYMISYVAHGSGIFACEDEKIDVSEGDILFLPPDTSHKFFPSEVLRIETYSCYFMPDSKNNILNKLGHSFPDVSDIISSKINYIKTTDYDNKEIRDIMIRLLDEAAAPTVCSPDITSSYLTILLVKMCRLIKPTHQRRKTGKSATVDMAVNFIRHNIYNHFSLKDLSEDLGRSPAYICRLFKKHIGMTTSEVINSMRVDKIKDILENTNKPIERIPEMFLYHPEYIKKIFKQGTGMTMAEYKEKYHYSAHCKNN